MGSRLVETVPSATPSFDVKELLKKDDKSTKEEGETLADEQDDCPQNVSEAELIRQRRLQRFNSLPVPTLKEEEDNESPPS